jgi:hypothetical protein
MTTAIVVACVVGILVVAGLYLFGHRRGIDAGLRIAQANVDAAREDASAARTAAAEQTVAATIAMRDDEASKQLAAELRADLKDSERKRLEVASCIGQVIDERQVWESLYSTMTAGCARAQHVLMLEIERLSKLAGRPIAPHVTQVMQETNGILAREHPPSTPQKVVQAKIDAVTALPAAKP